MLQEALPQIYYIPEVDLTDFIYKLHMLCGDFLGDVDQNMRSLMKGQGAELIAVMGNGHLQLGDAMDAYCSTGKMQQTIFTRGFEDGRAFLFHIMEEQYGHFYGEVLMTDVDTLRQDIRSTIQYPYGVSIVDSGDEQAEISLEEWITMRLCEKLELRTWGFRYREDQTGLIQVHLLEIFDVWRKLAIQVSDEYIQDRLNTEYMLDAENSDPDMIRIPMETAKQLLLYGDCPVYRLYPYEPEKLPAIAAFTSGLWYQDEQEFAIMPEDTGALNRLAQRETDKFLRNRIQEERAGKNFYDGER